MADDKPIIIIKKKGGHGGHHGGAWKVAYADFVTAMMAFFMVMWLLNTASQTTKQSIASYFRKPGIFSEGSGTPLMIGEAGILTDGYVPPHPEDTKQLYSGKSKESLLEKTGTDSDTTGNKRVTYRGEVGKRDSVPDDDVAQRGFQSDQADNKQLAYNLAIQKRGKGDAEFQSQGKDKQAKQLQEEQLKEEQMKAAAEQLKSQLAQMPDLKQLLGQVEIKVEADGLSIEIMDTEKGSMFQAGSARILPEAEAAFGRIAPLLAKFPNKIDVIGHTDSSGFAARIGGYSNWELSADRANAARRLVEKFGIQPERITNVVGKANRELKFPNEPAAPGNRRITLKMRFETIDQQTSTEKAVEDMFGKDKDLIQKEQAQSSSAAAVTPGTAATTNSQTAQEVQAPTAPTQAAGPTPTPEPFSVKDLLDPVKRQRNERVKLPDGQAPRENAPFVPGDHIFNDAPVVGPRDPFANLDN